MSCLFCRLPTKNPKFCSRNCAGKGTTKLLRKRYKTKTKSVCPSCKKQKYRLSKHCQKCSVIFAKSKFLKKSNYIKKDSYNSKNQANKYRGIRFHARKSYEQSTRSKHCERCGYNKYYEVCHIKAIKDFSNTTSILEINAMSNLIALCPNCHWEFDHKLWTLKEVGLVGFEPTVRN